MERYELPKLGYGYEELQPYTSAEQLRIHYEKHHKAYVDGSNAILERLEKARKDDAEIDIKSTLKALSFNIGGHLLHSLFWENLRKGKKENKPEGKIKEAIERNFGSFERFRKEFTEAAMTVEGSGWAALTYCRQSKRLVIMQIEKHNTNIYPMFEILMVVDVFEHAYYLDYKNNRREFVEGVWDLVNWETVEERLEEAKE